MPAAPNDRSEYYFGATGGRRLEDDRWRRELAAVSDHFLRVSSVGAIAVSESNPDVVYVGMGETQLRGNIIQGDGVYKTTDGGRTWTHVGLEKTRAIGRIRVHPANPDIVYVAALGDPYGATPDRGVFKSTDGGKTWTRVLFRDDKTGAVDLVVDPKAAGHAVRRPLGGLPNTALALERRARRADCSKRPTAARRGRNSRGNPGLPKPLWGKIGISCVRRGLRIASTPSSRRRTAGCSFQTMRARPGSSRTTTATSGSALSTTPVSTPIRRRRTRSTFSTSPSTDRLTRGKTLQTDQRAARRQSRSLDRA